MRAELRAYGALTLATLKMYLRNPLASFSLLVALAALLLFMKVLFGGSAPHTRVSLVEQSRTPAAATLVREIRQVSTFDVGLTSEASARRALASGETDMVVVVPPGLGAASPDGNPLPARVAVSYRAGGSGEVGAQLLKGVVDGLNQELSGRPPLVSLQTSALSARSSQPIDSLLPGVLAFNIVSGGLLLAAGVFAGHRSSGVLRRIKAAGIGPASFVLAHATSSFALGLAQTAALLALAYALYRVRIDLPALLAATAAGYLVFLAMGFAVAGWVKDAQRASAVAASIGMPMIFVGLFSAGLPPEVSRFTQYLPVSYVADAMRQIGEGAGLAALGSDLLWLGAWALLLLGAASRTFRWDST
jgi:ABC-2 type transport system permease protein